MKLAWFFNILAWLEASSSLWSFLSIPLMLSFISEVVSSTKWQSLAKVEDNSCCTYDDGGRKKNNLWNHYVFTNFNKSRARLFRIFWHMKKIRDSTINNIFLMWSDFTIFLQKNVSNSCFMYLVGTVSWGHVHNQPQFSCCMINILLFKFFTFCLIGPSHSFVHVNPTVYAYTENDHPPSNSFEKKSTDQKSTNGTWFHEK